MVQPLGHIAQFHKLFEISHSGVTTTTLSITHKWRTINRCQHKVLAADLYIALRIAGTLSELGRRCGTQLAGQSTWDTDTFAVNLGTSGLPTRKCVGVINEHHANLGQHRFSVFFNQIQRGFVQNFIVWDVALNVLGGLHADGCALCAPRCTAASACTTNWCCCCI